MHERWDFNRTLKFNIARNPEPMTGQKLESQRSMTPKGKKSTSLPPLNSTYKRAAQIVTSSANASQNSYIGEDECSLES